MSVLVIRFVGMLLNSRHIIEFTASGDFGQRVPVKLLDRYGQGLVCLVNSFLCLLQRGKALFLFVHIIFSFHGVLRR